MGSKTMQIPAPTPMIFLYHQVAYLNKSFLYSEVCPTSREWGHLCWWHLLCLLVVDTKSARSWGPLYRTGTPELKEGRRPVKKQKLFPTRLVKTAARPHVVVSTVSTGFQNRVHSLKPKLKQPVAVVPHIAALHPDFTEEVSGIKRHYSWSSPRAWPLSKQVMNTLYKWFYQQHTHWFHCTHSFQVMHSS